MGVDRQWPPAHNTQEMPVRCRSDRLDMGLETPWRETSEQRPQLQQVPQSQESHCVSRRTLLVRNWPAGCSGPTCAICTPLCRAIAVEFKHKPHLKYTHWTTVVNLLKHQKTSGTGPRFEAQLANNFPEATA
eukprot:2895381-Amphidinium_carterae.1